MVDQTIEEKLRQVMPCNVCFERGGLRRSQVDTPQPRPIGAYYETSDLRVVLVTQEPGAGTSSTHVVDNERFRELLHHFRDGGPFEPVAEHTYAGLRANWFGGFFQKLYIDEFGLDLEKIATANIAWCATEGNTSTGSRRTAEQRRRTIEQMRQCRYNCFKLHTASLLSVLDPDVVLLAGGEADKFRTGVQAACPRAEVGKVLHCSYLRKLHDADKKRKCIAKAKKEFDAIMERGRTRRASRGGTL
jgi:hypothetical protein